MEEDTSMDIRQIMEVLPHRPPFLLVDKITSRDGLNWGRGRKNLTGNEYFFQNSSELPRPILLEIMAQAGAACVLNCPEYAGKLILFASIEGCTFGRAAVPGDVLDIYVEMRSLRRGMGKMQARCSVGDEVLADGILMFAIADRDKA